MRGSRGRADRPAPHPPVSADPLRPDLGQLKGRLVGIESEGLDQIGLSPAGSFQKRPCHDAYNSDNAGDPGDGHVPGRDRAAQTGFPAEPVFAPPHDEEIAVELAHHTERGIEKRALEAELGPASATRRSRSRRSTAAAAAC